jgi:hypothetical protein
MDIPIALRKGTRRRKGSKAPRHRDAPAEGSDTVTVVLDDLPERLAPIIRNDPDNPSNPGTVLFSLGFTLEMFNSQQYPFRAKKGRIAYQSLVRYK